MFREAGYSPFIQQRTQQQQAAPVVGYTFYDTIAFRNPSEANAFLTMRGIAAATTMQELSTKLKHFVKANGERGLEELALIHPDKELVLNASGTPANQQGFKNAGGCGCSGGGHNHASGYQATPAQQGGFHNCSGCSGYSNCSGCGGKCGGHNNAAGSGPPQTLFSKENSMNALAVVAIIGILYMASKHV